MGIFEIFTKKQNTAFEIGQKINLAISPTVLLILDGWGVAPESPGNAIALAKKPNYEKLISLYPHGELTASGESVGLPANEVGNTEVGHLNMGAGRLMLQDLKRIDNAIKVGTFFENRALLAAMQRGKTAKLHILGLVGTGRVHSSLEHLYALMELCKRSGVTNVYYHLFTDGRDSPPKEAIDLIPKIEAKIKEFGVGSIATISGRYYGMDRDRRWERIQKTYEAMVSGDGLTAASAVEAVKTAYAGGITDEFIAPTVINKNGLVADNDAMIFFNYRIDRPRELTMAFNLADFENLKGFAFGKDPEKGGRQEGEVKFDKTFPRSRVLKNLFFVTMTEYDKKIPVSAMAYPPEIVKNSLSEVISKAGLKQVHMSESEKDHFVTYYFDGLQEQRFPGEDVVIVPSPHVATYDKRPEMSVFELVNEFKKRVLMGIYSFVVINMANPDMVAHTGNLKATISAVEAVDRALGELVKIVIESGGNLVITADHGNAEELITYPASAYFFTTESGQVNTDHSNSPVPLIIAGAALTGRVTTLAKGSLADVAPTILRLMKLDVPPDMTGRNLLEVAPTNTGVVQNG